MWKDGKLTLLIKDIPNTNGLAFSPDEKVLYVNGSRDRYVKRYDVQADGTLANDRAAIRSTTGFSSASARRRSSAFPASAWRSSKERVRRQRRRKAHP
jgi:gluconolactonase